MLLFRYVYHPVVALAALLALSSCAVGPDYVPPQPPQSAAYTADGDTGPHGGQVVSVGREPESAWWRSFRSSSLDRVMTQALQSNNSLEEAHATLSRAGEELRAVTGEALWPQVTLDGSAGRQKFGVAELGPDVTIPAFTAYTLGPRISYLLDFAGGERRAVERQGALAQSERYRYDAARLALTGQVMDQALALASAREQLAVLEDIIADDRKNEELVEISRKAGAATETDVLSSRSQLASDQALLPPLRQQLSVAEHALALLVGQSPANWQPPPFALTSFTLPEHLPLRLPSELARVRPDIQAAEAQVHAATAAIGVATAQLYPSLTLSADSVQESLTVGSLFESSSHTFDFGAHLTAPIFNGGSLLAQKRAAEQACRAALAHYRQVVLAAFAQVADVLKALEHDAQQVEAQQHALDTAQESLRLARLSYGAGNIGVLQVLDAERLSNQARLGLAQARIRRYQDTALLYLALGGGQPQATEATAAR